LVNGSPAPPLAPAASSYLRIAAIGVALLVGLATLIALQPHWNSRLQSAGFDTYQLLKPREVATSPVTVVEIDDAILARLGQWPWSRTVLAELVRSISRQRPAAIGIDILMPEPDRLSPDRLLAQARQADPTIADRLPSLPSSDSELARAIAEAPVVLGIAGTPAPTSRQPLAPPFVVVDRVPRHPSRAPAVIDLPHYAGALTNIDLLDRSATGHGLISAGRSDDVIRRIPLASRIADGYVPALPIEMLRVALQASAIRLFVDGPVVESIGVGDFVVPTETDGELRIYYATRDSHRSVSAIEVLDGKVDPLRFDHKLVLIGITGLAVADYQNTPLGVRMPGIEIQAQVLENLFDQTWLSRPRWASHVEVALFALLGLTLIAVTPRWKPRNAALLATAFMALPVAAAFIAFFSRRMVFDAAAPALGLLVLFSFLLLLSLGEAGRQRKRLEQMVQAQREEAAYIDGELAAAKRIQTGFLPRADFLRDDPRIELAAAMIPAREVGGDLYDFFLLGADRLFFLIGDVAGKGVSASMFMAVSKALYKSATLRSPGSPIADLMRAANDEVSRDNPEMFFVTVFAGVLDLRSGDLDYCNAGHEDPYLLTPGRAGVVRLTDGAGPPLCSVDRFAYEGASRRLHPGETLVLVTDGVADAQNAAGERYGSRRLQEKLAGLALAGAGAHPLVDALSANIHSFAAGAEATDDITVLALRWIGLPATA
jgi:serine phosphatase RsbU (regulator of sigma subunit)/CHASE2 domain-containing sensor protein